MKEPEEIPDLLLASEAAELLRVDPRTVRRHADQFGGRLIGGRWFFPASRIRAYLEDDPPAQGPQP